VRRILTFQCVQEVDMRSQNIHTLVEDARIKGIVQPFELGGETRLIRSDIKYVVGARQVLNFFLNDTVSREEHKTN
jgi:hypothetical protein